MVGTRILTPAMCKAARGLLEWNQRDLAKASGLSLTAIAGFERGAGNTREKTLQILTSSFENNGIEFFAGGLRYVDEVASIVRYAGNDFIVKMNDDIFATIRKSGMEIMTCSTDDHLWPKYGKESHEEWKRFYKKMDIREKVLVPESNTRFNGPKHTYRRLPSESIGKLTYCIYADRLVYILWKKKQIFIIRNKTIADAMREQFLYLWRTGRPA